jgi:isoleucyl-tRNA synthetase
LLTLWNVFSFFATYADIEGWEPATTATAGRTAAAGEEPTHVLDRWVLARLDRAVEKVAEGLDRFDALAASGEVASFVDDLSNWYVRRSRPRFWGATGTTDHQALATLHRCLVVTAQLLAPFCPFLADELYVRLTGDTSVHLSDWPATATGDDARLEEEMAAARRLVGLGRAARTDGGVKLRQPLPRALLLHPGIELSEAVRAEVADELNVKALEDVDTLAGLMTWTVVPNFRALGPRLGKRVNDVKRALAEADGAAIRRDLETQGYAEVAGERLGPADVEVRAGHHDDFAVVQDGGWAIALDLELDDALRDEGVARELTRELNDLRKQAGLALTDRIALTIAAGPQVAAALASHRAAVAADVLALSLDVVAPGSLPADARRIDVDGEPADVILEVVPTA